MKKTVNNTSGASTLKILLGIIIVILLVIVGLIVEPRIRLAKAVKNIQKTENVEMYIKNIETSLKLYKLDNGAYPTTEQGLQALATKPTTGKIPKNYKEGGYLMEKTVPKDPWGNDYKYECPGVHYDYDLSSSGGPDGRRIEAWNLR